MKEADDFSHGMGTLPGIDDARVFAAGVVMTEKVLVLSKDDSILAQGKSQLCVIRGTHEIRIGPFSASALHHQTIS